MIIVNKYLKHFKTITMHKFYVMKYCFKCGIYKRGLLHDLSKYGINEFCQQSKDIYIPIIGEYQGYYIP